MIIGYVIFLVLVYISPKTKPIPVVYIAWTRQIGIEAIEDIFKI